MRKKKKEGKRPSKRPPRSAKKRREATFLLQSMTSEFWDLFGACGPPFSAASFVFLSLAIPIYLCTRDIAEVAREGNWTIFRAWEYSQGIGTFSEAFVDLNNGAGHELHNALVHLGTKQRLKMETVCRQRNVMKSVSQVFDLVWFGIFNRLKVELFLNCERSILY